MSNRSKYLDTVLKLNRLTQDGKIEWTHHPSKEHEELADLPPTPEQYVTEQGGKQFVLYQEPVENHSASYRSSRTSAEALAGGGRSRNTVLELRDPSGERLFTFPSMSAIDDLYETVYTGRSNEVDAFLDEFLSEET